MTHQCTLVRDTGPLLVQWMDLVSHHCIVAHLNLQGVEELYWRIGLLAGLVDADHLRESIGDWADELQREFRRGAHRQEWTCITRIVMPLA